MAASDLQLKKRNNYKLVSDPELKKGAKKIYRINGKAGEEVPVAPEPEDPRAQKTVLGVTGKTLDMKVPRFKYDKYWIGPPPERDVFVIGLNDSVKGSHLKDLCTAVAPVQSIKFHRHPKTKAFLGAVTICFCYCGSGKKAVEKLDGVIVGGCYLRAELDDQGEHLGRYLEPVLKFLQEKGTKDELPDDFEDSAIRRSSVSESGPEHSESEGEQSLPLSSMMSACVSTTLSPSLKLYPFSILNAATPSPRDTHIYASTAADLKSQLPQSPLDLCRTNQSFPPLPSVETAPPLPPVEQTVPPLPPPPLPAGDPHTLIENISSDEEHENEPCQLPSTLVSLSPSKSPDPKLGDRAKYDPSLGLQTLLKTNSLSNVSQGSAQSLMKIDIVSNISAPSPHLSSANFELEVEEISGDDSPIMVYKSDFEPLQLESVSDVDSVAGGDDMEVCSDDETTQIELNVKPTSVSALNIVQPLLHHVVFPSCLREDHVYVSSIPPSFAHLQLPSPSIHFIPPLPSLSSELMQDSYEAPLVCDLDSRHPTHKYPMREKTVLDTKQAISLEVLVKALEQLKAILLNDVQKKLVEASAFSALDGFWDKERRTQRSENIEQQPAKPPEPYRRMLPGLKLGQDVSTSSDVAVSCTPRKRLLNFKIPLVHRTGHRRDQHISVVTRRRIFSDQEDKTIVRPQQESYIATLSDVSSGDEFSSAESTESDYENEDSDYFESHTRHSHRNHLEIGENIPSTGDVKLAEEDTDKLEGDTETVLNTEPLISHRVPAMVTPSRAVFKKRSPDEEESIVLDIYKRGLDWEEVQMFRLALSDLKHDEECLVADVRWSHYPHDSTNIPSKRRRVDHTTGCARSEGYYKIGVQEKLKYLPHHQVKSTGSSNKQKTSGSGRVNRANQRRLASVYSGGDISNDLAKYNQLKARKKLIKFAKSTIHNWGLFAMENIAADEMVIEYIGEVVRQTVADERERRYEAAGIGSSYLFRVDHDYIIDATRNGNLARFINHCCDPNCYAKVISFGMQKKIIIYSKRDIAMGEEITYDYKFPIEDEKIPCLCGAPNCRGTLN